MDYILDYTRQDCVYNSFVAAFVQNCYISGKIPNMSGTVSPIRTRQAANKSARVGLCGNVLYKVDVKNCTHNNNFRYTWHTAGTDF